MINLTTLSADLYSNKAIVVTQDSELLNGEVVYVVAIEKRNAFLIIHRFCILQIENNEYKFTYNTVKTSETIHIPYNILNIANYKVNEKFEQKYNFYKPQVWTIGFEIKE